jgi:hypothetical protein
MPRLFGGNTELGKQLNEMGSKSDGNVIKRKRTKRGIIKEVVGRKENQGEYIVILDIYDADGNLEGKTSPIPLAEDPVFLAANYGMPEELINRFWCKVEYEGPSVNRGSASIVGDRLRDREMASKSNELQVQGAAFAPPGSGLF